MNQLCDYCETCCKVYARVNNRDPVNGLTDRKMYYDRCLKFIDKL